MVLNVEEMNECESCGGLLPVDRSVCGECFKEKKEQARKVQEQTEVEQGLRDEAGQDYMTGFTAAIGAVSMTAEEERVDRFFNEGQASRVRGDRKSLLCSMCGWSPCECS